MQQTIDIDGSRWILEPANRMVLTIDVGELKVQGTDGQPDTTFNIVVSHNMMTVFLRTPYPHPDNPNSTATYAHSCVDSVQALAGQLLKEHGHAG